MTEKIQISMPGKVKKELDKYIEHLDMNRSKFFIVAAYKYMEEHRKKEIHQKLVEGYSAMAAESESIKVVRAARTLQAKTLKDE